MNWRSVCIIFISIIGTFWGYAFCKTKHLTLSKRERFNIDKSILQAIDFSGDMAASENGNGYYIFSQNGKLLYFDKQSFVLKDSYQLGKGKGPGEYLGISRILLNGNQIYLYDYRLMKLIQFCLEDNILHYEDTINLDFQGALEASYKNERFFFNTLTGYQNSFYPAVEIYDDGLNGIDTIIMSDLEIKTQQDIANNLGWFVVGTDYLYYISLGNGNVMKIDLRTNKVIKKGFNKKKKVNVKDNIKEKHVSVFSVSENGDKLLLLYLCDSKESLFYEIFDKENLDCVNSGFVDVPYENYVVLDNVILSFTSEKCDVYEFDY
jgi:hypothetical protein